MSGQPILRARGVHVAAGRVPIVHGVDLELRAGERVALVGGSGSGKSLLAAAICGTLPPSVRASGSVEVAGVHRDLDPGRRRLRHLSRLRSRGQAVAPVALVRQDPSLALHPLVTVGRQVARAAAGSGRTPTELLAGVGLDPEVAERLPAELSGGQRQRAATAFALACAAPVLVADEPTTALDGPTQARVLGALDATPGALLLITHDLAVAAELCHRVLVMDAGHVVDDLPFADLVAGRGCPQACALVADLPPAA